MTDHTAHGARAGRREWAGLAVLTLPALLASMDLSVLFLAAPWLAGDLQPSGPQLLWILDVYGFLMAGLLLTMGGLGDRIGRRKLLVMGALAFGAASVLAAYATTTEMLIAARALLGVGGATLAPSTLALIRTMFRDDSQRAAAVGVWTAAFTSGTVVGPLVGGLLLEHFWWGSVFLINVPVMVLLLVAAPLLPESRERRPGRFDLLGAAMSIAAVLLVIHGGKEIAHAGAVPWQAAVSLALGGLIGVLFVRRQARAADPLVDVHLFRRRTFSTAFGAHTAIVVASAGTGLLTVQFMQVALGLTPFTAALWQLPAVAGTLVGIVIATGPARKALPATVAAAGLVVAASGLVLVGLLDIGSTPVVLVGAYTVLTVGTGLVAARAIDAIVSAAPAGRAGSAAALGETGAEFGAALGIATLGSIASAGYRARIVDALPAGLPPEAAEAVADTLGGAITTAEQLPPALGASVLGAAQRSFTDAFTTTALVGAGLLAVTAAALAVQLRSIRTSAAAR